MDINISELLKEYRIRFHPECLQELMELIEKSGKGKRILKQLYTRLEQIKELGEDLLQNKNFEHLKKYGNLYSMHVDTDDINLRVLYSVDENGHVWLHMFIEKKGKKVTEYKSHAPVAVKRRDGIRL